MKNIRFLSDFFFFFFFFFFFSFLVVKFLVHLLACFRNIFLLYDFRGACFYYLCWTDCFTIQIKVYRYAIYKLIGIEEIEIV